MNVLDKIRLTPACAGKTVQVSHNNCPCEAHPRLRGEDRDKHFKDIDTSGSPPLARGRLRLNNTIFNSVRLTPACAGKTELEIRTQVLL